MFMKISHITFVFTLYLSLPSLFATDLPQGYVIGWGDDALYGCNGVPSASISAGVVTIDGQILSNAVAITAGSNARWAVLSDGTVFGWGNNTSGRVTGLYSDTEATNGIVNINGIVLSNVVTISPIGFAIRSNGAIDDWRLDRNTNFIAGFSNIISISSYFALKADGTVVTWGKGAHGEKLSVPVGLSNVVAMASGAWDYGMALQKDGTVVEWNGGSPSPAASTQSGLSNVVAIASGVNYHLALKKDGTVFGWGRNDSGEATGVATRDDSSGLVTIKGEVLSNAVAIAASKITRGGHSLALKKDGTLISWGYSPYNRLDVPEGLSNVVAIAAGDNYCLAITTNRAVAERFMPKSK